MAKSKSKADKARAMLCRRTGASRAEIAKLYGRPVDVNAIAKAGGVTIIAREKDKGSIHYWGEPPTD